MTLEEKYKVRERSENAVKENGSIEKAILYLKAELNECESLWSSYSCDCLGYAITCNRLLVSHLENKLK